MPYIRSLRVALMFLFVFGITASAYAEEPTKILPEPTAAAPLTFVSTIGAHKWRTLGGKEITCAKGTGSGEFTTPNLGRYKFLLEGCKGEFSTTCTGVGDKVGTILLEGTVHYVLALLSGLLVASLAILIQEFHYTCEVIGVKLLILQRGSFAALAEPVEKLTKATKDVFVFDAANSGDPDITRILMEEAKEEISSVLLSSINGAEFESAALEGSATNEGFKKAGKAVEVLLMNKKM
jgi:hypothetical protein